MIRRKNCRDGSRHRVNVYLLQTVFVFLLFVWQVRLAWSIDSMGVGGRSRTTTKNPVFSLYSYSMLVPRGPENLLVLTVITVSLVTETIIWRIFHYVFVSWMWKLITSVLQDLQEVNVFNGRNWKNCCVIWRKFQLPCNIDQAKQCMSLLQAMKIYYNMFRYDFPIVYTFVNKTRCTVIF